MIVYTVLLALCDRIRVKVSRSHGQWPSLLSPPSVITLLIFTEMDWDPVSCVYLHQIDPNMKNVCQSSALSHHNVSNAGPGPWSRPHSGLPGAQPRRESWGPDPDLWPVRQLRGHPQRCPLLFRSPGCILTYLHNSDNTTHFYNRSAWLTWSSRSLTWSTCCPTRCRPRGRHGETPLQSSRTMSTSAWSGARYVWKDDSVTDDW